MPGEQLAALLIAQLAEGVIALNEQIKTIEQLIEDRFRRHELAEVIASMPGIGALLGVTWPGIDLEGGYGVVHRFTGTREPFGEETRMCTFVGTASWSRLPLVGLRPGSPGSGV